MPVKNLFERISAVLILIILSPVFVILAAIIAIQFREFPFFLQERGLTLEKNRFRIIKFKTIRAGKIKNGERKKIKDIFYKEDFKSGLSGFSGWLRRTGLDELPQIINVIKGEMSFIGPRPLMIDDLELMAGDFGFYYSLRNGLKCNPGITCLWQLLGKREKGIADLIELDLIYDNMRSVKMNMKIVIVTIPYIIFAYNSDSIIRGRRSVPGNLISAETRRKIRKRVVAFLAYSKTEEKVRKQMQQYGSGLQFSGRSFMKQ